MNIKESKKPYKFNKKSMLEAYKQDDAEEFKKAIIYLSKK